MDTPELKTRLFGYSRKSVRALLLDRDLQMVQSAQQAREADTTIAGLTVELGSARREAAEARLEAELRVAELETTIATLGAELDEARRDPATMQEVVDSTRQALDGLFERARRRTEEDLRDSVATRDALRGEIEHLIEWRDRIMRLAEEVHRSIGEVRTRISTLSGQLTELAEAPPPVTLVASPDVIRLDEAETEIEAAERPESLNRTGTGA